MADGGEGGRGGGGRRGGGGGGGLHRSRSSRRPTVVTTALVIEYDNGMAVSFRTMGQESAVMRQLRSVMTELTSELEEAGDWHLHTISGGPRDGVYRGHASGDSDGGVTPVRDAGGRGGAVPYAEPEPEAQAQADAQLSVQWVPAGDGGAHDEPEPPCARPGCRYLRHKQNSFAGFCCGRCRDPFRWGHGPQCHQIPWRTARIGAIELPWWTGV